MIFWPMFWRIIYPKANFCFNNSIFHWQIKLILHRSDFWHLRRNPALTFSKWLFFQTSWIHELKTKCFYKFSLDRNRVENCDLFRHPVFTSDLVIFDLLVSLFWTSLSLIDHLLVSLFWKSLSLIGHLLINIMLPQWVFVVSFE